MPVISIIYIFMIKRKNAAGPGRRDAGPGGGSSGSGTARGRRPGPESPGCRPRWSAGRRGPGDPGRGGGSRQVDLAGSLHLAPPGFCP